MTALGDVNGKTNASKGIKVWEELPVHLRNIADSLSATQKIPAPSLGTTWRGIQEAQRVDGWVW